MSIAAEKKTVTVALLGNPNTGKSTLFSALCGVRQHTGNYPGVTVEKKVGRLEHAGRSLEIVDLPGTYSLAPRSPDEMIAVDLLLGRLPDMPPPDAVICIVDASNLERNLYLVSQILELGLPLVLAVNMVDVAATKGVTFDAAKLAQRLQLRVVPIQANKRLGLDELKTAVTEAANHPTPIPESPFPAQFQAEITSLQGTSPEVPRYLLERLLLDTAGYLFESRTPGVSEDLLSEVKASRRRLTDAKCPIPGIEAMSRYKWVASTLAGTVTRQANRKATFSDRLDRFLTHRFWGSLAFILLMIAIFQTVFYIVEPTNFVFDYLAEKATALVDYFVPNNGPLRSLLVDGVIAGVGGVVPFLPQILVLFFFIGVLEDCGYMARAAYLMDKIMSRVGLSGKSFIPLLSSFACAIPGIMGARVIENPRDRLITILVAPLMSCSARMPVYLLMVSAFFPDRHFLGGWLSLATIVIVSMYLLGTVTAVLVAMVLKRTILPGKTPPFILELPMYKVPSLKLVFFRMLDRAWAFLSSAGTVILAVSILVWAAGYYPRNPAAIPQSLTIAIQEAEDDMVSFKPESPEYKAAAERFQQTENEIAAAYLADSYLGRAGHAIEPAVRPLGWDWRIGCAAIASFPAREVIVGTLGTIFSLGGDRDAESPELRQTLQNATRPDGTKLFNVPVALSIMVFFALCAQCSSTLAVIRRETNSWGWAGFSFVYMTALAYLGAMAIYHFGMAMGWGAVA